MIAAVHRQHLPRDRRREAAGEEERHIRALVLISMRGMAVMSQPEWIGYLDENHQIRIDPDRLDYWIALNLFKGACIDQTALAIFMSGRSKAPNLLAIGTCVHVSALKRLAETVL